MKKLTKWTAALLAAMMVWLGFLSCSNPGNDSEPENENAVQNPSNDSETEEVTPYTFGSAGAALAEAMFTSLPGTSWADKEGSLHDKWTFSSLNDGKIPLVATMINDD